jgi:hypothetical protein
MREASGDKLEPRRLETGINLTDDVLGDRVGFNDGKGAL